MPHRQALGRIGAVIESPAFYPNLSGRENLEYFRLISGRGSSAEVDHLLQKVGLAGRGDDRFRTYSLGMKQRLGIAYALLGDPELVCLDEPTQRPGPRRGMIQVRELIRSLGDGSRTVLLSSHLLHEIEQVCDRVTIISKGKLVVQGEVAELVRADSDELVRVKTTDDGKARAILSALDWVRGGGNDGGWRTFRGGAYREVGGVGGGHEPLPGLRHRDVAHREVPRTVFPGSNRQRLMEDNMMTHVLTLTRGGVVQAAPTADTLDTAGHHRRHHAGRLLDRLCQLPAWRRFRSSSRGRRCRHREW